MLNKSFEVSDLNSDQVQLLLSFFQPLETSLLQSIPATNMNNSLSALLKNAASLVAKTHSFNTMKYSFLWVLKQYLLFFNAYTSSLQKCTQNSYQVTTAFVNEAKSISQALSNSLVQTITPPLFFYDAPEAFLKNLHMIFLQQQCLEKGFFAKLQMAMDFD